MSGTAAQSEAPNNRSWLLTVLIAVYASNFVDRTIVNILQQPIKEELALQDWQLGLLGGTSFAVFYTFLGLYVARLAERGDRVTILTVCILLWSAFTVLCGAVTSFIQLLLLRIGVAIGEAGATPTGHSLISDHYPADKRAGALALFASGNTIGTVLGALIGGFVGQAVGWRWAFVVAGAPGIVIAAITFFTLREPRRQQQANAADVPPFARVARMLAGKASFRQLAIAAALMLFASYGLIAFVTAHFIRSFGLPLGQAGLIGGVGLGVMLGIGTIAGGLFAQRLARTDRRWLVWAMAWAMVAAAPLCTFGFLARDLKLAVLLLLPMMICMGVFQGPLFGTLHSLVEPRMRATASALMLFVMTLVGLGLGPLVVGIASDFIAAALYPGGGFDTTCRAGTVGDPDCQRASANGLRYALAGCGALFAWSAIHFARAARTVREDIID